MAQLLSRKPLFEETVSLFTDEKIANARSKIIECLNDAANAQATQKCEAISKVQEILLHSDSELLDEFIENILAYSHDPNQDVRKTVAGFISEVCKQNIQLLPRVINSLIILLRDRSPQVIKKIIQGTSAIYHATLQWLSKTADITDDVEQAWNTLCLMKAQILDMIDNENDGIRTNAIKFLEGVVLMQSYPDEDSIKVGDPFSLEDIPLTLKIVRRRKLEDEALQIFDLLLKFHGASHISSVNLITCNGILTTIARMRPSFMAPVVEALKNVHSNLPPTLSNSQVNSVRKNLKMQFIYILKHPSSYEQHSIIIPILADLGASNTEISRSIPKLDKKQQQRRAKRVLENATANAAKKSKIEKELPKVPTVSREMEIDVDEIAEQKLKSNKLNENFITDNLKTIDAVIQLVILSMPNLPEEVPQTFLATYSPVINLTIQQQLQNTAQLLAQQMTDVKIGPGNAAITKEPPMRPKISAEEEKSIILGMKKDGKEMVMDEDDDDDDDDDDAMGEGTNAVAVPVAAADLEGEEAKISEENMKRNMESTRKLRETLERVKGEQAPKMKQRIKTIELQEITKPLSRELKNAFLVESVKRILRAEKQAIMGGVSFKRRKILTVFASTFMPTVRNTILDFIKEDFLQRFDLAFSWLYEEYSLMQGFTRHSYVKSENSPDYAYNEILKEFITHLIDRKEFREKELLLRRLYIEAPLITDDVIQLLVQMCELEELSDAAMILSRDMLLHRPTKREKFLNILLKFSVCKNTVVREKAIESLLVVYSEHAIDVEKIEKFSVTWLKYLEKEIPPHDICDTLPNMAVAWNEDLAKVCISLFLAILPYREELVHTLCSVYTSTTSDMKRTILRVIEQPIRKIGSESVELLRLIETCPKGAETLITRVIYILTEKSTPTSELVERVRNLHLTKVPDVRLLIPVIVGLTKKEILNALPKLIKLNPAVVKEVFNRLLGIGAEYKNTTLPISPTELLVSLHTLDTTKIDIKSIMKATTQILGEKEVYTHEILGMVMQQLVDITPIPTLLMRTVIQSLTLYPRLSGFIINILQRLILKHVWKQKIVWDGFLKCCQRLIPQSLGVLIQLPALQLQNALKICPDLRQPLLEHAREISESQICHVSQQVMDVLLGISQFSGLQDDVQVVQNPNDDTLMHEPIKIKQEKDDETEKQPLPPGME